MPNVPATGPEPGKSGIQSFLFAKDQWTKDTAAKWLQEHEYRTNGYDEGETVHRFRQFNPDKCDPDTYQNLTENFPDGVTAVSCKGAARSTPTAKEQRWFAGAEVRVVDAEDGQPTLQGYAAVFDALSEGLGFGQERVARGAFKRTLDHGGEVKALWNHNDDMVLGSLGAGTLKLVEDTVGLEVVIHPVDAQWARDRIASVRRGDVTQMSFGFRTIRDSWEKDDDGVSIRTLHEVQLIDVSPVPFPAYPQTSVALRSFVDAEELDAEAYEQALESLPLTNEEQRVLIQSALEERKRRVAGPGPESHPADAVKPSLSHLRRKLELEEL